jgi:hypothetical protein
MQAMKAYRKAKVQFHLTLTLVLELSTQIYPQSTLPTERIAGTQSTGDWVGPRASLEVLRTNSLPCQDLNPNHRAHGTAAIPDEPPNFQYSTVMWM